jgi:hypothetical protein
MQTIYTHIKPDGRLDINPELLNKILGKELKIIYIEEKIKNKRDSMDIIKLLDNGPKIEGGPSKITKEWIYDRGDNDPRYR